MENKQIILDGRLVDLARQLSPLEHSLAALNERLNAFFHVFAIHHAIADMRNDIDRRFFARRDEFKSGFFGDLNANRCILRNRLGDFHCPFDLLPGGHDFLHEADFEHGRP